MHSKKKELSYSSRCNSICRLFFFFGVCVRVMQNNVNDLYGICVIQRVDMKNYRRAGSFIIRTTRSDLLRIIKIKSSIL